MPPWALFYAYRILVFLLHLREEDSALSDVIAVLKLALERLDVRWNIAGEFSYPPFAPAWSRCSCVKADDVLGLYLQLLEAHAVLRGTR